jgi:hypothetical protein
MGFYIPKGGILHNHWWRKPHILKTTLAFYDSVINALNNCQYWMVSRGTCTCRTVELVLIPDFWSMISGLWSLIPDPWSLISDLWSLISDLWSLTLFLRPMLSLLETPTRHLQTVCVSSSVYIDMFFIIVCVLMSNCRQPPAHVA